MRTSFAVAAIALLSGVLSPAQTPVKATSEPAKVEKPDSARNQEMNIRAYIELLRSDLRKTKAQITGEVMQLDAEQSANFWPVYKEFEAEYSSVGDEIVALIRKYVDNYDRMTDSVADQVANQVLSVEQKRNELKKKYYDRMKNVLGAITAARFLQVENQLERLADLQISAQLPVVREQ
jgi:hypothetical protein